jgi:hypothetical protein
MDNVGERMAGDTLDPSSSGWISNDGNSAGRSWEEDLGGVRRELRTGTGGGPSTSCSGRSLMVPIEKLCWDSGVAGGEGGRLGANAWASIQGSVEFSCEVSLDGSNCALAMGVFSGLLENPILLPGLGPLVDDGREAHDARLKALTAEL